jgi:hypothetical protein
MKLDFGEVLSKMWKIGWNHKVLWFWQILPALLSIVVMPFAFVLNPAFAMFLPEPWNQYAHEEWVAIAFVIGTFIMMIPIMFAGIVAQLTTTYGAVKVDKGAEKLAFLELFRESLPYFWRMLGLYAIFGGAWVVICLGFMAFFMFSTILTAGLASICIMPLFIFLFPIMLVGYSVLELAQTAIIADDMGTLNAISHGWKLFRTNWLAVVLLMVILYFALSTLSSIFIFPMMFPMMLFPLGLNSDGNFNNLILVFFAVIFPIMFALMYIVQGILMAFFQVAWAVAYIRLNRNANAPIVLEEKPQEAGS